MVSPHIAIGGRKLLSLKGDDDGSEDVRGSERDPNSGYSLLNNAMRYLK